MELEYSLLRYEVARNDGKAVVVGWMEGRSCCQTLPLLRVAELLQVEHTLRAVHNTVSCLRTVSIACKQ